jgi:hypothetical protein
LYAVLSLRSKYWKLYAVLSCAANIENFTRQKKKGVGKPQAVECYAAKATGEK